MTSIVAPPPIADTPSPPQVQRDAANRLHLSLTGELDIATVFDAFGEVIEAQPAPGEVVMLDMSEVTFIDSSGLSMLLRVRNFLDVAGAQLTIANPSAAVTRSLMLIGLTEYFSIEAA